MRALEVVILASVVAFGPTCLRGVTNVICHRDVAPAGGHPRDCRRLRSLVSGVWRLERKVEWKVGRGLWRMECGVWSVETSSQRMESGWSGVWRVERGEGRVDTGVCRVECEVWSVNGVWRILSGWSGHWRMESVKC